MGLLVCSNCLVKRISSSLNAVFLNFFTSLLICTKLIIITIIVTNHTELNAKSVVYYFLIFFHGLLSCFLLFFCFIPWSTLGYFAWDHHRWLVSTAGSLLPYGVAFWCMFLRIEQHIKCEQTNVAVSLKVSNAVVHEDPLEVSIVQLWGSVNYHRSLWTPPTFGFRDTGSLILVGWLYRLE